MNNLQLIPVIRTKPNKWEAIGIVGDISIRAILKERPDGSCRGIINLVHEGQGYDKEQTHASVDNALYELNQVCGPLGFEFQVVKTCISA